MVEYIPLFSEKYLKERLSLSNFLIPDVGNKIDCANNWVKEIESKNIYLRKEEQLQSDFLNDIFGKILGYTYRRGLEEYNLEKEEKSKTDGTKPDGVLGYLTNTNRDIRVVIELKDAYTNLDHKQNRKNDNRTPVEQAFSYVSKSGGNCKWVIVSNFVEIRVYPSNDSSAYQKFMVKDLSKPEVLKTFYALLAKDRLFCKNSESIIDGLLKNKIEADTKITNKFYADYKKCRTTLFNHIKENNTNVDDNIVLTKSQKILDRIIFVCFCEDIGLLPYKIFNQILEEAKTSRFDTRDTKLWEKIKVLFNMIDKGYPTENINRFNGGLFKEDEIIDNFIIRDSVLADIISLEAYDFESDLNVNILGHIFEQSITDLEEIKASLNGITLEKKKGIRNKEGVFYTPEHITKYIVDEAIGGWLEDKKKKLGYYDLPKFTDEELIRLKTGKTRKNNVKVKSHLDFWLKYRDALNNITICDPACGSGSFLVQVFNYLKEQSRLVYEEIANLEGESPNLFNFDQHILSHNIYGVDLNAESVEITKLALWLKTANKNEPLTSLDNNIKCGNSLIDAPEVDSQHAFNWNKEFPDIMAKGGFDVIVGNPPYVSTEYITEDMKIYFKKKYCSAYGRLNLYTLFYEKGICLLNLNGKMGYITPYTLLKNKYFVEIRRYILENSHIKTLIDFKNHRVFSDADVDTIILILEKNKNSTLPLVYIENVLDLQTHNYLKTEISQQEFYKNDDLYFHSGNDLLTKIFSNKISLGNIVSFKQGIITGDNKKYLHKEYFVNAKKVLRGEDFNRYNISFKNIYLEYGNFLHRPRTQDIFEQPSKIIIRQTGNYPIVTVDNSSYYTLDTVHNGKIIDNNFSMNYILSILNSRLIKYVWFNVVNEEKKAFGQIKIIYLNELPIPRIPLDNQDKFVKLVDTMLFKNQELQELSEKFLNLLKGDFKKVNINTALTNWYDYDWIGFTDTLKKQKIVLTGSIKEDWYDRFNRLSQQAKVIKSTIDATDKQIDSMIYKLYNLTDKEIAIIEDSMK